MSEGLDDTTKGAKITIPSCNTVFFTLPHEKVNVYKRYKPISFDYTFHLKGVASRRRLPPRPRSE